MVEPVKIRRRRAIKLGTAFAGTMALGSNAMVNQAGASQAGPGLSKAAVGYRDIPYNGRVCAQCVFFQFKPAINAAPASRCELVAGLINPAGWCEVWAPKA